MTLTPASAQARHRRIPAGLVLLAPAVPATPIVIMVAGLVTGLVATTTMPFDLRWSASRDDFARHLRFFTTSQGATYIGSTHATSPPDETAGYFSYEPLEGHWYRMAGV